MQLQQIPAYQDRLQPIRIAPAPPACAIVSVTGDTVVGTNEKHRDWELWACGVTRGCHARKVRESSGNL